MTTLGRPLRHSAAPPPRTPPAGFSVRRAVVTDRWRYVLAVASLLAGALALIALTGVLPATLALLTWWAAALTTVGLAPWQFAPTLRLHTRLALATGSALSLLTLGGTAMTLTLWLPWLLALLTVAGMVAHGIVLTRVRTSWSRRLPARDWLPRRTGWGGVGVKGAPVPIAMALCAAGGVLALALAAGATIIDPPVWGLPLALGWGWIAGLLLCTTALPLATGAREWPLAVAVGALVAVLSLSPTLAYPGPWGQSTNKHVDLAEQIIETGAPVSSVQVYNDWPGMFAASAWVSDLAGAEVGDTARWWIAAVTLLRLPLLRWFFSGLGLSGTAAWWAAAFTTLADAIGSDYFSPQSLGTLLAVAIFALALRRRPGRGGVVLLVVFGCAITVTHQLSPYMVAGGLVVLALLRLVRWWIPLTVLVPALAWTALHADAVRSFLYVSALGDLENFRPPQTVADDTLTRHIAVTTSVIALVVGILLICFLALWSLTRVSRRAVVRRLVLGRATLAEARAWACALVPAVGLVLVAVNPYGQEGIFRAALFAIPWLAALAAVAVRPRMLRRAYQAGVAVVLLATSLLAGHALDVIHQERPADLEAMRIFHSSSPDPDAPRYLLELGTGNLPTIPARMSLAPDVVSRDILGLPVAAGEDPDELAQSLTESLVGYMGGADPAQPAFALWSPTQQAFGELYAVQSAADFAQVRQAFVDSPWWEAEFERDGTVLFRFDTAAWEASEYAW
ncbi:hypothetical protein [Serinibacter salmoneus]|uniref:Uncharacterized protein n=1 Tax=Serinibacter salmoneus TaxID=556530 RepID=A0A2A9CZV8_9MICO|nr:hypothetical protein [Serinibacter salmoneus]PFG19535.1 hypothetical protein ATL40_1099 [Serinibacter salmoneus]